MSEQCLLGPIPLHDSQLVVTLHLLVFGVDWVSGGFDARLLRYQQVRSSPTFASASRPVSCETTPFSSHQGGDIIHALCFSPCRYWLCAATESSIKIWDLESKSIVAELVPELPTMSKKAMKPECISLQWTADGSTLYSGYTDNTIRVWGVS